jgi:hypothetical protein
MWQPWPSSQHVSDDHKWDLQLRTHIWNLWNQLPKASRNSWTEHPEFKKLGAWFAFYKENYFRWRNHQGPLLRWPVPWWEWTHFVLSADITAAGTAVSGTIHFQPMPNPGLLALSFYPVRRWDCFSPGLKGLYYIAEGKDLSFHFTSMRPGWQKGQATMFNETGALTGTFYLDTVFCK